MPEGGVKAFSQAEKHIAEIAQLVEHNLAKVGVASSSLVFRSKTGGSSNRSSFLLPVSELRQNAVSSR